MKTVYLLFREINVGIKEMVKKHDLISIYFITIALAYVTAFLLICMGWYIYEWSTLRNLNQNGKDTLTALGWSFLLMLPIADIYAMRLHKELKKS